MIRIIPSKIHRSPESHCPTCNHTFTVATSTTGDPNEPRTGDVSICFKCGEVLIYDYNLKLVRPNESEWKSIQADWEMYAHIRECQRDIRQNRVKIVRVI